MWQSQFIAIVLLTGFASVQSCVKDYPEGNCDKQTGKFIYQGIQGVPDHLDMNAFRAVFVTVPNLEVGRKIAHGVVTKKLAACVNIVPSVTSVYEWEGKIEEDSELILMIKTSSDLFGDVEKFVKENHPYDVPEVIAVPIEQGSKPYLDWISSVVKKPSS